MKRQVTTNKMSTSRSSRQHQVSVDHLLNFLSYQDSPEFDSNNQKQVRILSKKTRNNRKKHHLHGMQFINVHYKFVVDHRKQYKMQQVDPNIPVDISDIIRIIVTAGNACPICLSEELIAPRMITSCGHILCLTCLLALLESEVPADMKKESKVISEKYNDCPLCGSIIRMCDIKPVQIETVDLRFETPKVGDEVVLSLMTRTTNSVVPTPRRFDESVSHYSIPWAMQTEPNLSQYSRFFKGDLAFLTKMYEQEKEILNKAYVHDKETYGDDGRVFNLAIKTIDNDLAEWAEKFSSKPENDLSVGIGEPQPVSKHQKFYYYQTGFKTSTTYVLSPLDMKILKTSFNSDYTQLPSSVIAKVENIRYSELDSEIVASQYKYLSHLPSGTPIGFLECNWQNNEFISQESWETFKKSLQKRTKASGKKFRKEEVDRQRALKKEERRAREYIERQNNAGSWDDHYDPESCMRQVSLGSLSIKDHRYLPELSKNPFVSESGNNSVLISEEGRESIKLQRSVWGTQIPKSKNHEEDDGARNAEEMIKKARDEIAKQEAGCKSGKKKKKKFILLSS